MKQYLRILTIFVFLNDYSVSGLRLSKSHSKSSLLKISEDQNNNNEIEELSPPNLDDYIEEDEHEQIESIQSLKEAE